MSTILDQIGGTPMVKLNQLNPNPNVEIWLKLEGNNPAGSVKDRPAYNMIKMALERGEINKNSKLIEATSGNTGIALAMIAKQFNLAIELVMPHTATKERILTMKAYGAKVTLTESERGMEASRDYAEQKVTEQGYVMLDQFSNDDNWKAHYKTTGPEIWKDSDHKITHFVSSMGTTGTIMGTSTYLKEQNVDIKIIGAQPTEGSKIPGIRKWPEAYLPRFFDRNKVDEVIEVSEKKAREMANLLVQKEGVFAGMSSGGAVAIALEVAKKIEKGVIVAIICDRGDRYLSSDLFE
ncbi:cysteine synthase [Flavobacteriaceae bacterium UJ101]|nr:cysteine synthase [Flavobacteriaceae bacterium UJ101]